MKYKKQLISEAMRYVFKFPDIGEGLEEGTIVEWYVNKGQHITSGDALCKMETDKVVTDIPSPKSGTIAAIYGSIGETINVGDPLVEIELEDSTDGEQKADKDLPVEEGAGVVGTLEIASNNAFLPASDEGVDNNVSGQAEKTQKKAMATPVARAMAKEMGIDINKVTGTGPAGRVMKENIREYLDKKAVTEQNKPDHEKLSQETQIEILPMTQLRKTIARNMIISKQNAAHMTILDEVEISELIRIRNKYKNRYLEQGVNLSYLPFIIKATTLALKKFGMLNAEMDAENNRILLKKHYNIGIAVDTNEGLVVPVIKDADKLSVFKLAEQVNILAEKARDKTLEMEEIRGGTFTITSFGSIGGMFAAPVINYPQTGILGIGRIVRKPVVENDKVIPGNVLPLSLAVDHRIVDGGIVARFINQIMEYLGDPISLIMD